VCSTYAFQSKSVAHMHNLSLIPSDTYISSKYAMLYNIYIIKFIHSFVRYAQSHRIIEWCNKIKNLSSDTEAIEGHIVSYTWSALVLVDFKIASTTIIHFYNYKIYYN